jgi:IS5 family transposase
VGATRQRERAGSRGGEATGKDPTNRVKLGTKRHLVVDRTGLPLAITISGANVHDSRLLEETVDAIPQVRLPHRQRGRPRKRPAKLHADKGYDYPRCRQALRSRSIVPRIARRGIDSSERLGRYRWVMERTLSWLNRSRRLKVRYERLADIHHAFLTLGCALICWQALHRRRV